MRNHFHSFRSRRESAAFTLVEVLVVIVIIAVLTSFAIMGVKKSMAKAASIKSISNIRQSGTILLGNAAENNGRLRVFRDGVNSWDFRHYYIVGNQSGYTAGMCEIMHWNAAKLPGGHWNCRGINFTHIPAFGVQWNGAPSGDGGNVWSLSIGTVTRPEAFPFLLDSSEASGAEIFRLGVGFPDNLPGLRNSGKAHGYFLDGSARELGPAELKKAGFTRAYDNSVKPPKVITL